MISKNRVKFINSLQKKKIRAEEGLFVIEGDKLVNEFLLANVPVKILIAREEFLQSISNEQKKLVNEIEEAGYEELKRISNLKTPHNALAIIPVPERTLDTSVILNQLCVALDFVQDPGNFGTIIRAAAWFGIKNIICSHNCVDLYNPKVIQASMGAILHVDVFYSDLKTFLKQAENNNIPVFGTLLNGDSIFNIAPCNKGIILFGNESNGISEELIPFISHKIKIPGAGKALPGIESLNVSMAASIVFYEFLRNSYSLRD